MDQNLDKQPAEIEPAESNTPYDDVFRTESEKAEEFLLPVLNEAFGENYTGDEEIVFSPNEHFNNLKDGKQEKRITDSYFTVNGADKYLFECQSTNDNSILLRVLEYCCQICTRNAQFADKFTVKTDFSRVLILYLRYDKDTPNEMTIVVNSCEIKVKIIKIKDYTLDDIFRKNLLFLLPFYIFNYDKKLEKISKNEAKTKELLSEFISIVERLDTLCSEGKLDSYHRQLIIDMSLKCVRCFAKNYDNIKEGVESIMRGAIIKTKSIEIYEEGIEKGRIKGENNKAKAIAIQLHQYGDPIEKIAKVTGTSVDEVQKWLNESN